MPKIILFIALISAVAAYIWLKPSPVLNDANILSISPDAGIPSPDSRPTLNIMNNELPALLRGSSLKGTAIDGVYPVDDDGNLVINDGVKHRFDYFLSTLGEFPLEQVQQMIRDDIELNLQSPAREQTLKLFEDYMGYKFSLVDLEQSLEAPQEYEYNDIERMRFQLQQLRDKRREYFDQDAVDAFFGFDELYDDYMLNRLEIQASSQLSAQEKAEQIDSLEQSLPESVKDMRTDTHRISQAFNVTRDMRENGANDEEVFDYNSQEFGQAAAERLQALDEKRQRFQNKVSGYLNVKKTLLNDDTLSEEEKTQQLDELLEGFSDQERRRLYAFETMLNESQAN